MIDDRYEGIVIAEAALEPKVSAYRLIRDGDPAPCIATLAENIGGSLSDGEGEGVAQAGL